MPKCHTATTRVRTRVRAALPLAAHERATGRAGVGSTQGAWHCGCTRGSRRLQGWAGPAVGSGATWAARARFDARGEVGQDAAAPAADAMGDNMRDPITGAHKVYTKSDCVNPFRTQQHVEECAAERAGAKGRALAEDAAAREQAAALITSIALPAIPWRAAAANEARKKGSEAFKRGEYNAAVAYFDEAISADMRARSDAALWCNRSAAKLAAGNATGAVHDARHATTLAPKEVKPLWRLAKALEGAEDRAASRATLRDALMLDPNNAQLLAAWKASGKQQTASPAHVTSDGMEKTQ